MSRFVNFGKRSIELPAGCKDLIDVLKLGKRSPVPTWPYTSAARLADVAKHLSVLLERAPKCRNLVIWHQNNYVHLINDQGVLTALVVIHEDTGREQAIRRVFEAAGIAPTHDEEVAGGSVRVLRYVLSPGAPNIEELISHLLRNGYGLAENMGFRIGFWDDNPP